MMRTMSTAFTGALLIAPATLIASLIARPKEPLQPLPVQVPEQMRWGGLVVAAALWIAVAVIPQRELANTVAVEKLMKAGRPREALDFLAARQPGNFAPARALPPKPFEREVFTQLPACFGAVQTNDPPWVRALLLTKLDAMMTHLGPRWRPPATDSSQPREERIETIRRGLGRYGPDADGLKKLYDGLQRFPEGQAWLAANDVLFEVVWERISAPSIRRGSNDKSEAAQRVDWLVLSNQLRPRFLTNASPE